MKAHINGITIEGTPQEIMEYQRMQAEKAQLKPISPTIDTDWIRNLPRITSGDPPGSVGSTTKRCAGPCYCTGACETKTVLWDGKSLLNV